MNKQKKYLKKLISIVCVIALYILNSERIYAMESLNEMISEKLISSKAKEYEMNIVLHNIVIRRWNKAPYAWDEIEDNLPVDAPLGEYSAEKLKEYTDENFRAEFEYCCGYISGILREEHLIQIVRIYKDDELYVFAYYGWFGYEVNDVVMQRELFCTDIEDFRMRVKENEEY